MKKVLILCLTAAILCGCSAKTQETRAVTVLQTQPEQTEPVPTEAAANSEAVDSAETAAITETAAEPQGFNPARLTGRWTAWLEYPEERYYCYLEFNEDGTVEAVVGQELGEYLEGYRGSYAIYESRGADSAIVQLTLAGGMLELGEPWPQEPLSADILVVLTEAGMEATRLAGGDFSCLRDGEPHLMNAPGFDVRDAG